MYHLLRVIPLLLRFIGKALKFAFIQFPTRLFSEDPVLRGLWAHNPETQHPKPLTEVSANEQVENGGRMISGSISFYALHSENIIPPI